MHKKKARKLDNTLLTYNLKPSIIKIRLNDNVVNRIMGEGILVWPDILEKVKEKGYDGWLSLEYERRWHSDDIPDASIVMKKSAEYLKKILS